LTIFIIYKFPRSIRSVDAGTIQLEIHDDFME